MTDRSAAIATVRTWLQNDAGVSLAELWQLLDSLGYTEERAADFRGVILYYRPGWPRFMGIGGDPEVPVGVLHRICTSLLPYLNREHSA